MATSLRDRPSITRADRIRERELLHYYQPRDDQSLLARRQAKADFHNTSDKKVISPDIALTALAQLVAIRLNVRSVLINVITKDTQYTISEGTKSLDLANARKPEAKGDDLWIGCDTLAKEETVCQQTIKLHGSHDGPNEFLIVPDLSKDERFSSNFYVAGPPYWRFYVGTPLTTSRGINIGALCLLDDEPRASIAPDDQAFCATIAQTIMRHLEMNREVEEGKRRIRMSTALNAFVEGKSWLAKEGLTHDTLDFESETRLHREASNLSVGELSGSYISSGQKSPVDGNHMTITSVGHQVESSSSVSGSSEPVTTNSQGRRPSQGLSGHDSLPQQTELLQDGSKAGQPYKDSRGYEWTFARAANLLRESLDLHEDGGIVFFDTAVGFSYDSEIESASPTGAEDYSADGEETVTAPITPKGTSPQQHTFGQTKLSSAVTNSSFQSTLGSQRGQKRADVLGYSTSDSPLDLKMTRSQTDAFKPLTEKFLQKILKRYPRGVIWNFDEDGGLSTSEEELATADNHHTSPKMHQNRSKRKEIEGKVLQSCFPGVRQLLFAPLWDAGLGRWFSACFCFSRAPYQMFSKEIELNFLVAFGNSVMAEVSRLVTIAADQQKGDFIGSISHELRSPLHGILASAEFLADTDCDNFQNSLIDTIDSCGRTLLDTINHVLDFSKINSFERNLRKASVGRSRLNSRSSRAASAQVLPGGAPPLLNIYAITDVAAICEEVVEGVYAGQTYQDISSTDISDISTGTRGRTSDRGLPSANRALLGGSGAQVTRKPVEVILDIDKGDFTFTTQPGAVRRIIMNVFGNALKYTEEGTIIVKLEQHKLDGDSTTATGQDETIGKILVLKVIDTGRGISSQYLRTRLFTPFAQENTLAPGTGLGLSMVRSITNMLGGSIDIRSQVGKGTEVKISLPLMRTPTSDTPVTTPSTISSMDRSQDDSVSVLQAQASGTVVSMYGFDEFSNTVGSPSPEVDRVLRYYISTWYGLEVLRSWPPAKRPDIIIVDEQHLPAILSEGPQGTSIISLCSNSSRYGQSLLQNNGAGTVEFVSKPFGPYKLARAFRQCLEKSKAINSSTYIATETVRGSTVGAEVDPPIKEFEAATLTGDDEIPPVYVQTNGIVTATETENAQMALRCSSDETLKDNDAQHHRPDFPFPLQGSDLNVSSADPSNDAVSRGDGDLDLDLEKRVTEIESLDGGDPRDEKPPSVVSNQGTTASARFGNIATPSSLEGEARSPRLLLVDDNKINLRLLQTFMRKRKYQFVDSAENGCLAVQAAEMQKNGYDIIFMDISMPVMDGFEATRAIRELEESRREARLIASDASERSSPALIIALTGLASSRDQSEAFTSGVDLFMTKPISFKEIGRLLDNWEANRGIAGYEAVSP